MLIAIAAMTSDRLIGKNNTLPRNIPADLKRFKELTTGHTVIMGRKTYESLPEAFRPLPWRHNIILSHSLISPLIKGRPEGSNQRKSSWGTLGLGKGDQISNKKNTSLECYNSIDNLLTEHKNTEKNIFIIWWSQIYRALLSYCDSIYITEVKWRYEGDAYFPEFKDQFNEISRESYDTHDFVVYERNSNNS
jgi:dihydrofolate reductase